MRDGTTPRCPVAHNGVITSPSTVSPCCSHTMVPSHQGMLLLGAATPLFARGRKSCSVSKAPRKEPSLGEGCFVTPILAAWRMILELGLELSSPGIQAGGAALWGQCRSNPAVCEMGRCLGMDQTEP